MMIMSLGDKDIHTTKCEGVETSGSSPNTINYTKTAAVASTSSSSRQWSGHKNPRIVRVSRTFGGKDRHSKVCTIRGLRDRRIRLSVPTAIQLYDLQDRLGLTQPSKVIDWLLDATKLDINKLPPLQIPLGSFDQYFHQAAVEISSNAAVVPHHSISLAPNFFDANLATMKDHDDHDDDDDDHVPNSLLASKDLLGININHDIMDIKDTGHGDGHQVIKWNRTSGDQDHDHEDGYQRGGAGSGSVGGTSAQAQNFFPISTASINNTSPFSNLLAISSNSIPYNYYHWDPNSSLASFSQYAAAGSLIGSMSTSTSDQDASNSTNMISSSNAVPMLPSSSFAINPTGSTSQLFFCPSMATTTASLFPSYINNNINHQATENRFHQYQQLWNNTTTNAASPAGAPPSAEAFQSGATGMSVKSFPLNISANPKLNSHQSNESDRANED